MEKARKGLIKVLSFAVEVVSQTESKGILGKGAT